MRKLRFSVAGQGLVICRLEADAIVPAWAPRGAFFSVTRTQEELSLVCAEERVPADVKRSGRCALLKLHGPFPLTETGVASAFVSPLAEAGVPVFLIATFDTDYVLVPEERLEVALAALKQAGHELEERG